MKKTLISLLLISLMMSGCSVSLNKTQKNPSSESKKEETKKENPSSAVTSAGTGKMKKFTSQEELKNFLANAPTSGGNYFYGRDSVGIMEESAMDKVSSRQTLSAPMTKGIANGVAQSKQAADTDFSRTNNQVESVDEADIVKTDGKYIYTVSRNSLFITEAYPVENASVLAKIEFKSMPQDIFLNGDYLVVYGYDYFIASTEIYRTFKRGGNYSFFKVFNISDKKNPKEIRDLDFEGNFSEARMIGDYVYFAVSNYAGLYEGEPVLPRVIESGAVLSDKCAGGVKCLIPDVYYFDMPYTNYNFTSIYAVNVKNPAENISGNVYLSSNSENMYVSENNIYFTETQRISEEQLTMDIAKELMMSKLTDVEKQKIEKISAAEDYVLSKDEKFYKIQNIINRVYQSMTAEERKAYDQNLKDAVKKKFEDISKELEKTIIHKIAISNGKLGYKNYGEVTGYVLNQFSMDEGGGYFRIATTKSRDWSVFDEKERTSYSNLYVLDEGMKVVGKVEGLAKSEQIYSVRFMQNRAYMVTFQRTDPLFVISLEDPKNPTVLGELKIPGFSNYLHPYDENTLIGLGLETGENNWGGVTRKGLKVSLFDVADVKAPKEKAVYVLGEAGSDSTALYDHKAFLFSKEKNLLAIPVSLMDASNDWNKRFVGAAVFEIKADSIKLRGKIEHPKQAINEGVVSSNGVERLMPPVPSYIDNTIKRSLYIKDVLYTLSDDYLKMNNLEDLSPIKELKLEKKKSGESKDYEVVN